MKRLDGWLTQQGKFTPQQLSVGYLCELKGNDQYDAFSLALGGVKCELYRYLCESQRLRSVSAWANSPNLGRFNAFGKGTLRERALSLALFLDGGDSGPIR
jgi:hypothetical protein